jgi:hypothetical protein
MPSSFRLCEVESATLREVRCSHCVQVFYLCRYCDHGQIYCSVDCRTTSQRRINQQANKRHQQITPEGNGTFHVNGIKAINKSSNPQNLDLRYSNESGFRRLLPIGPSHDQVFVTLRVKLNLQSGEGTFFEDQQNSVMDESDGTIDMSACDNL